MTKDQHMANVEENLKVLDQVIRMWTQIYWWENWGKLTPTTPNQSARTLLAYGSIESNK